MVLNLAVSAFNIFSQLHRLHNNRGSLKLKREHCTRETNRCSFACNVLSHHERPLKVTHWAFNKKWIATHRGNKVPFYTPHDSSPLYPSIHPAGGKVSDTFRRPRESASSRRKLSAKWWSRSGGSANLACGLEPPLAWDEALLAP